MAPVQSNRSILFVVFTTILIDFAGFSVLFPVLPLYAERLGATPFEVGLIQTSFSVVQLLFLPVWGWFSDRFGRRPVLLFSLFGTAVSFGALSLAESVVAICAARALAGFFAASIATAQAVVTDVTDEDDRARGMGLVGAAIGLGMMMGPVFGGLLSEFGEKAPFYGGMLVAAANFAVAWFRLPESRPEGLARPAWPDLRPALVPSPLRLVFSEHDRRIRRYLYLYVHVFTAFAVLESMFTLFAGLRFGLGMLDMGLVFTWLALFGALTQGIAIRRLVPRFGEPALLLAGLLIQAVGLVGVAAAPSPGWFYVVGPIIAVGNGIALPSLTSLYSQACEAEHAGEFLGQSHSMATTGRILGPMLGGWLMQAAGPGAPFAVAAAMMVLAAALFRAGAKLLLGANSVADTGPYPMSRTG